MLSPSLPISEIGEVATGGQVAKPAALCLWFRDDTGRNNTIYIRELVHSAGDRNGRVPRQGAGHLCHDRNPRNMLSRQPFEETQLRVRDI
jgi:hypothetical protein